MADTELQHLDLPNLVTVLQEKVASLERQLKIMSIKQFEIEKEGARKDGKLGNLVAEHVGAVVGLKETLTWKNLWFKLIWAILFCAGIGLTVYFCYKTCSEYLEDPTATKIKLVRQKDYPFPPYILCPDPWVDYDKALRMGLSLETITYSVGLFFPWSGEYTYNPPNISRAKKALSAFFNQRNYTSMHRYFKDISIDFRWVLPNNDSVFDGPYYSCNEALCGREALEKTFTRWGVCYKLPLMPLSTRGGNANSVNIFISTGNYTNYDENKIWPTWPLFISGQELTAAADVETLKSSYISSQSQQFSIIGDASQPCESKQGYSQKECDFHCLNDSYSNVAGCALFPYVLSEDNAIKPDDLLKYCNKHELHANARSRRDAGKKNQSSPYQTCIDRCLQPCERTLYDVGVRSSSLDDFDGYKSCAKYDGMSEKCAAGADINFENRDKQYGGILVLSESYTFSFATLIGNVGGVLGLFVGATGMTFVQVILFFAAYYMNRKIIPVRN